MSLRNPYVVDSNQKPISDAIQRQLSNRITYSIQKHEAALREYEQKVASEVTHAAVQHGLTFNQKVYQLQIKTIDNAKKLKNVTDDDFADINEDYSTELNSLYITMYKAYEDWLIERGVIEEKAMGHALEEMPKIAELPQKKSDFNKFKLNKKTKLDKKREKIVAQNEVNNTEMNRFDDERAKYSDQMTERSEMIQNLQRAQLECQSGKLSNEIVFQLWTAFVREADLYPDEINQHDVEGLTILHHACNIGCIALVTDLLQRKADPNIPTKREGFFPAHLVAKENPATAVELLAVLEHLATGAVAKKSFDNMTVLHMAATSGNIDVIRWLWLVQQQEFPIDAVDEMLACTPLHNAVYHNHPDVVSYLLIQGADHRIKNRLNETPLVCAMMQGPSQAHIVQIFTEHGICLTKSEKEYLQKQGPKQPESKVDAGLSTEEKTIMPIPKSVSSPIIRIMQVAFSSYHLDDVVKNLSDKLSKEKRKLSTTQQSELQAELTLLANLQKSLQSGDLDLDTRMKLDKYLYQAFKGKMDQADSGGYKILHYMSAFNDISWISYLKYTGIELACVAASNGYYPLHFAVHNRESTEAVFELLVDKDTAYLAGMKDHEGNVALHRAAESGNLAAVKWLVERRSQNINCVEVDGAQSTPLHKAAAGSHLELVSYLLTKNANMTIKNRFGETALVSAIVQGHVAVTSAFLVGKKWLSTEDKAYLAKESGQNTRKARMIEDCLKNVSLHQAAECGNLMAVQWLVENRAQNINSLAADGSKSTPLHKAAAGGHADIVEYLLAKNADVTAQDQRNETPLVSAIIQGHLFIAKIFFKNQCWLDEGDKAYLAVIASRHKSKEKIINRCLQIGESISPTVSPVSSATSPVTPVAVSTIPQSFVNQLRDQNVAASVAACSTLKYENRYSRVRK